MSGITLLLIATLLKGFHYPLTKLAIANSSWGAAAFGVTIVWDIALYAYLFTSLDFKAEASNLTRSGLIYMALAGVSAAVATLLQYRVIGMKIPVSIVAITIAASPLIAIIFDRLIFGTILTLSQYLGIGFIIIGVLLVNHRV